MISKKKKHLTKKLFTKKGVFYRYHKDSKLCLVFLHGWANDWTVWKDEFSYFSKRGFSCLAIDIRGHGLFKPEDSTQYSLDCFVNDLTDIFHKEKIKDFVIIGHSMGGMIALNYYQKHKKGLKALVLADTTYCNILRHKRVRVLSPFIRLLMHFILKHKQINRLHFSHIDHLDLSKYKDHSDYFIFYQGLHNTPLKSVFACLSSMMNFNVRRVLKDIKIPVLIVEGENDSIVPKLDSLEMLGSIPDAEISFIPKTHHFISITKPKKFDKCLSRFFMDHNINKECNKKG